MATAVLELNTERVDSSFVPRESDQDLEMPLPGLEFATSSGRLAQIRDFHTLNFLSAPQKYRLSVKGPYSASLDLPLQQDTSKTPQVYLQTPELVQGFRFTFVAEINPNKTVYMNMNVKYVLSGIPIEVGLEYVRFLYALHSDRGAFYIQPLEPRQKRIEVAQLPLPYDRSAKQRLKTDLDFLEQLETIGKATNTGFTYPANIDREDLRNVNRVLDIIQKGWAVDYVADFTLPLHQEGIRNLLDYEGEVLKALAITAEGERVSLFGTDLDLGPSLRWIAGARLDTPKTRLEEWLASNPDNDHGFETRWTPISEAPFHVFFPDWPKPSLERVDRDLDAYEEKYGMSSKVFRAAWRKHDPEVEDIDDGDTWMSLIEAKRALERGHS